MAETTALVTIEKANALAIFSTPGSIDPILARIREQIDEFVADVSTKRGREEVASIAYRVAQTKSYLDGVGKALVDELKDVPKKVDASRKKVRDTLDTWKDEVRQPLTDWENAEQARVDKHRATLARLTQIATAPNAGCAMETTAAQFREKMDAVGRIDLSTEACEEFKQDYALCVAGALRALHTAMGAAEQREAEAVELARLRAAQAERDAAEERERFERLAQEKAEREVAEAAEQKRLAAERKRLAAERAEAQRVAGEERAARQKAEAEAAALRKAEADRVAAEKRETLRQAQEKEAAERAAANTKHRARINREARDAFVTLLQSEEPCFLGPEALKQNLSGATAIAQRIVEAIAKGEIPCVKIEY